MNCHLLPEKSFLSKRQYLIKKKEGLLREKVPTATNPMMSNPMGMMDMMKGNIAFMVQNMVMMNFVGYLFSGFVLGFPFDDLT